MGLGTYSNPTLVSKTDSAIIIPNMVCYCVNYFQISGGGGKFSWGWKIQGAPSPPLYEILIPSCTMFCTHRFISNYLVDIFLCPCVTFFPQLFFRALTEAEALFPGRTNVDIIFGRPKQTLQSWRRELREVTVCNHAFFMSTDVGVHSKCI